MVCCISVGSDPERVPWPAPRGSAAGPPDGPAGCGPGVERLERRVRARGLPRGVPRGSQPQAAARATGSPRARLPMETHTYLAGRGNGKLKGSNQNMDL